MAYIDWRVRLRQGQELPPMAGGDGTDDVPLDDSIKSADPKANVWELLPLGVQQALLPAFPGKFITSQQYQGQLDPLTQNPAVVAAAKAAAKPPASTAQAYVEQWVKDPNTPEGATLQTKDGTYTKQSGVAQLTSRGTTASVRGTLNWQRQQDSNGDTYWSRVNEQGQSEYMQKDGSPTTLLSQAYSVPKNVSAEKTLTINNKTYTVIEDPSKGGTTLYRTKDGQYVTDRNAANVDVGFPVPGEDKFDTVGGKKLAFHQDPQAGGTVYRYPDGSYKPDPAGAQDMNSLGGSTGLKDYGGNEAKPVSSEQSAGAQLPGILAKQKNDLQGALRTQLDQIAGGMKSGQIGLGDGIQLMEQAVQESTKNYLDASTRASTLSTFQGQQVTQATDMARNATNFVDNVVNLGSKYNYSNAAGPLMGQLLQNGPALMKSYGGGPVDLKSPLETMGVDPKSGLPDSFVHRMNLNQPVTPDQQNEVKQLIAQGTAPQDAVVQVAKNHNILPPDFGGGAGGVTSPSPAPASPPAVGGGNPAGIPPDAET